MCYCQGVEKLMELEPAPRGLFIRTLVAELERIHSHLLWLGIAGHEAGFDTFFMYTWRDREVVMDLLEIISGNRVHYSINTFGGARRDIDDLQKQKIFDGLEVLKNRTNYYLNIGVTEPTFIARLSGVGKLTKEQAVSLCAVGPTLRASGVPRDVRKDDPYAVYAELPFEVCTADSCDVLGRAVVRIKELIESYKMCEYLVKNLPVGEIKVKAPRRVKENEVVSRYEAPRGENIHYIKSNGTDKPPTLANYAATIEMLKHGFVADIPLIFAAIDPCICCAERSVTLIDSKTGEEKLMFFSQLRKWSIEHYNKKAQKSELQAKSLQVIWPL
jgi:NADH-quinone oxidoreductase subunit D